ncbi:MAG TPA: AAA family ATPase, partial [Solirubrobacteraceae bacterium]|nr:AAA family ATPase [Solirubrobacteraceae bacterium]
MLEATLLPGPLRLPPSSPFVGRAAELGRLRALVPRGADDGRRIALVGGEAGSGKSRLVRELAQAVAADGVTVLYGACDAVVRTPYQPFADALGRLVRSTDAAALRADLGATGGELARLLPELRTLVGDLSAAAAADPDTERHRLHAAVADLLGGAGARAPVLIVVEDLHWADGATLLLLRHLARSTDGRVLVVATFRDTEAEVPPGLADALADLRRADDVVRLHLAGLGEADVTEFVRRASGARVDREGRGLVRALRDLTEGNAFLLCELWRALVEREAVVVRDGCVAPVVPPAEIAAPDGVREVVGQRLARLEDDTRALLELAAVAGPAFELTLLRAAAPEAVGRLDALEPAVRGGLVEELPGRALAYRFTHELVRRALYDGLGGVRRAELHLRIAEALERAAPEPDGRALADLAHHFA